MQIIQTEYKYRSVRGNMKRFYAKEKNHETNLCGDYRLTRANKKKLRDSFSKRENKR